MGGCLRRAQNQMQERAVFAATQLLEKMQERGYEGLVIAVACSQPLLNPVCVRGSGCTEVLARASKAWGMDS
jgi:hypothetical protein